MKTSEFSKKLAKRLGIPHQTAKVFLSVTIDEITKHILSGQIVKLRGFGSFYVDVLKETRRFNVATNKVEIVPKRFVLKSAYSEELIKKISAKKIS